MRTSCGRRDDEPTQQARENPPLHASSLLPVSRSIYYNRLEYRHWFRLLCAVGCHILRFRTALSHAFTLAALGTPIGPVKRRAFLSLVQGRESCHKRLCGVTPFRRGIA
jgi:hypothetical protein